MTDSLAAFEGKRFLNLETFRKNGEGVRTPVWFALTEHSDPAKLYVYTTADAGKVKRIRRDAAVKIAPCSARGNVTGPWIDARAELVTGDEFDLGMRLLNRKYRPWKQLLDLFARFSPGHQRVMLSISC